MILLDTKSFFKSSGIPHLYIGSRSDFLSYVRILSPSDYSVGPSRHHTFSSLEIDGYNVLVKLWTWYPRNLNLNTR